MKFTFRKYIRKIMIYDLLISLFILCFFLLFDEKIFILLSIFIILIYNIYCIKSISKVKKFVRYSSSKDISKLEKDLSNPYLIYDNWYLTDEYMFSVLELIKINYKEILVVEGGVTLGAGKYNSIKYKQIIYLKNGKKYKLKSSFLSSDSNIFNEVIKEKNSSTYFGVIEEYMKIKSNV